MTYVRDKPITDVQKFKLGFKRKQCDLMFTSEVFTGGCLCLFPASVNVAYLERRWKNGLNVMNPTTI